MKEYKLLFADLDGTLIEPITTNTFPQGVWDMKIKFDVLDKIKELNPEVLFIVTNQGGIESGFVNQILWEQKIKYICAAISEYCKIDVHYEMCPSNKKEHPDRKPNTGMIDKCMKTYFQPEFLNLEDALMIGDASGKPGQFSNSDLKCAENCKMDYMDIADFINTSFK